MVSSIDTKSASITTVAKLDFIKIKVFFASKDNKRKKKNHGIKMFPNHLIRDLYPEYKKKFATQ